MNPYEFAIMVVRAALVLLVIVGPVLLAIALGRITRQLNEIHALLQRTPRYFADAGKPRTNPLPYSYPSKKKEKA